MLSKEYMAGYIDGKGGGLSVNGISIENNEEWILLELQKYCGGRIGICSSITNKKPCYRLHINREETIKLLKDVMGYLMFQKSKAKKVLDYLESEITDKEKPPIIEMPDSMNNISNEVKPNVEALPIKPIDTTIEDKNKPFNFGV